MFNPDNKLSQPSSQWASLDYGLLISEVLKQKKEYLAALDKQGWDQNMGHSYLNVGSAIISENGIQRFWLKSPC